MGDFTESLLPGTWIVDFVPLRKHSPEPHDKQTLTSRTVKHLPIWFPGATFLRTARAFREVARAWGSQPYEFVRQQMSQKKHAPSYLSGLVEKDGFPEPGSREENVIKWSAAAIFGGGSDTASTPRDRYRSVLTHIRPYQPWALCSWRWPSTQMYSAKHRKRSTEL